MKQTQSVPVFAETNKNSTTQLNSNEFVVMKSIIEQLSHKIDSLELQSKIQTTKIEEKD